MSAYVFKATGEYPIHFGDIIIKYPNATEDNIPDDLALVVETPKPDKGEGQGVYESTPIEINGVWIQQWIVRDLTQEEKDSLAAREQAILDKLATLEA
jgi:hypothetical protein